MMSYFPKCKVFNISNNLAAHLKKNKKSHFFFFKMEPTVDDLQEFKRLLAAGSTPYVEEIMKREIAQLEDKFKDTTKKQEKKPEEKKETPKPNKPTYKSQPITSYAFLDNGKTAKIIIKNIDGLDKAKIEFYPEDHGFVLYVLREEQNLPNLRLGVSPTKKILPDQSKYATKGSQITVTLMKKKDVSWSKLKKAFVPKKPKDEEQGPEDPQSNMMDMLRKMYNEASDEEKRNLNKAAWEGRQKRMQKEMEDI